MFIGSNLLDCAFDVRLGQFQSRHIQRHGWCHGGFEVITAQHFVNFSVYRVKEGHRTGKSNFAVRLDSFVEQFSVI